MTVDVPAGGKQYVEEVVVLPPKIEVKINSKSISKNEGYYTGATSTITANFNFSVKALNADLNIGYKNWDSSKKNMSLSFDIIKDGQVYKSMPNDFINLNFSRALSCDSYVIYQNNTVSCNATLTFDNKSLDGTGFPSGTYNVFLKHLYWDDNVDDNNFSIEELNNSDWTTSAVSLVSRALTPLSSSLKASIGELLGR